MVVSKLAANQNGSILDVVLETRGLPLSGLDPEWSSFSIPTVNAKAADLRWPGV